LNVSYTFLFNARRLTLSKQEAFIFTTSPYMDKLNVITSITTSDLPCHNVTLQRRN